MDPDVLSISSSGWEQSKNVSDGSLSTTNEQLALIGFAHRLGSTVLNNDPGIADEVDIRKEAKLLMSLSCSSPTNIIEESGRITPQSDVSSCYSTSSLRDSSFSFTCPSLSLENHSQGLEEDGQGKNEEDNEGSPPPAALLGRVLKVDDKDALRLSSEAMSRNIMQSYQKALAWRIKSWASVLGRVLVDKEKSLKQENASEDEIKGLLETAEAQLILKLSELAEKIQVLDATTTFKVSPQRVSNADEDDHQPNKEEEEMTSLEEHEYKYHVGHMLNLEGFLNIFTPGAGYIQIDLQIPGTMKGTFFSSEGEGEHLTDVVVELNTVMLASMIEKSSRTVVRSSVEALLKDEPDEEEKKVEETQEKQVEAEDPAMITSIPACTPKRIVSEELVSGLVVVTPRDASSPSSFADSDNDDKPVLLSIPDDFSGENPKTSLRMLTPQPSRARDMGHIADFTSRLPSKKKRKMPLPTVITPHKNSKPSVERENGPILPLLVEVACAAMQSK